MHACMHVEPQEIYIYQLISVHIYSLTVINITTVVYVITNL